MTADAFAVSTDGGKTWNAGMDSSGNAVVNILSAIGVQAEWIEADNLSAISANLGGWKINKTAISKDVTASDGNVYRVYFQPPLSSVPDSTWVLSCQKSTDSGKTFYGQFVLYSDGSAMFGNGVTKINSDGSAKFGSTTISSEGAFSMNKLNVNNDLLRIQTYGEAATFVEVNDEDENRSCLRSRGLEVTDSTTSGAFVFASQIYIRLKNSDGSYTILFNAGSTGSLYCTGNFFCGGTKSREVDTTDYGNVLQYCYEMPSPFFGDIGTGIIDDTGKSYVYLEEIFAETVSADCEYYVFLQKEGQGDLWVEEKAKGYFVVSGTPGLRFSWEAKARQRDYEYERLETATHEEEEPEIDYGTQAVNYLENYEKELYDYEETN
jgi:hypothetical protein